MFLISAFIISCNSQFAVKNRREIEKLQINQDRYIGKSVTKLINDLKVDIIIFSAHFGHDSNNCLGLRFYNESECKNLKKTTSEIEPAYLYIFLNERNNFDDKLFVNPNFDLNDSIGQYRRIFLRDDKLNNNRKLVKPYRKFTVSKIYANSEKEKK
ncbi:MAG: hypothetical protein ACXWVY_05065 [Kaistella sp.]